MNKRMTKLLLVVSIVSALLPLSLSRADYELSWRTIDGGGSMWTTGGSYELSGTIGQPDGHVTVMTGGGFEMTGGFWTTPPCWCLCDMNNDGSRDGLDVQAFIDCVLAGSGDCVCADTLTDGTLDMRDVAVFVDAMLAGESCP